VTILWLAATLAVPVSPFAGLSWASREHRARRLPHRYHPAMAKARPPAAPARVPSGARAVARIRKLCLALPEAVEKPSHGEPTWFAGEKGRVFAMLDDHHHGAEHLSVWVPLPLGAQEALIARDPARFFRPPYVGGKGWVAIVLDGAPDWEEVARLVAEAHATVARPRRGARRG
jgi:predicted DNA-binding protein (MmcQ/YjbR family)